MATYFATCSSVSDRPPAASKPRTIISISGMFMGPRLLRSVLVARGPAGSRGFALWVTSLGSHCLLLARAGRRRGAVEVARHEVSGPFLDHLRALRRADRHDRRAARAEPAARGGSQGARDLPLGRRGERWVRDHIGDRGGE